MAHRNAFRCIYSERDKNELMTLRYTYHKRQLANLTTVASQTITFQKGQNNDVAARRHAKNDITIKDPQSSSHKFCISQKRSLIRPPELKSVGAQASLQHPLKVRSYTPKPPRIPHLAPRYT